MDEKIKTLNLLPMSEKMRAFVLETFPDLKFTLDRHNFDYVRFYQGQPFLYSKEYINEHSLDDLLTAFAGMAVQHGR